MVWYVRKSSFETKTLIADEAICYITINNIIKNFNNFYY